ncbi:hypothetical protein OROGR_028792 [Orobanche gracilis]
MRGGLSRGGMSAYDNVVGGKLKLKSKALDVKAAGFKKKKKQKKQYELISQAVEGETGTEQQQLTTESNKEEEAIDANKSAGDRNSANWDDNLTPVERRCMEQKKNIEYHKLTKTSNKSHRDRIEDFNQYLANMSEHYDIPKVGPG